MGGKAVEVICMDACPSPAQGKGGVLFGKGFDGDCGEHTGSRPVRPAGKLRAGQRYRNGGLARSRP
ncbi:hypothetical protein [Stenotrophomonas sp. PS02297]|uniref:hypothetical protein n=1 Tax=Stenotrophomonas sp. PS02297 TaxID=2991423 RepID=UPI00249C41E7|nr:hypothetical protein [Stenotrophomonas sp. PS02297]